MKSYIATLSNNAGHAGGLSACLAWGCHRVVADPGAVVKVHRLRPQEKQGQIIAEITCDGIRWIRHGRYLPAKRLKRHAADGW